MKMQKIRKVNFNDRIAILLSAIVGVIVFLLIYGPYSLNVCEDAWILGQYDGPDIIQNYAGWTQYRISNWNFPLGFANKLAYGDGTYITYTDSIPYVAILCKLFRDLLPETFQFFGWFTLVCFALQGIGACLLIKRKYRSYIKVIVGDIFFLAAPISIERVFKHTALGAQWFILFAMYYYLEYRSKAKDAKLPWQMIVLTTLTIGIHPYFLPMVMIFVLLVVIEAVIRRYSWWKTIGFAVLSVVCPYAMGIVIGALGTDIINTRSGYGYFGMNLNSLINPRSHGGFTWSHVLPEREWAYSTYEGFNYLGFGMILMALVCVVVFMLELIRRSGYIGEVFGCIKRNIPLIFCMLFMTIFALTNNIIWDDSVILQIPLPEKLIEYGSIFRSSGRMFYPVYYLIMLSLIYYLLDKTSEKVGGVLLIFLLFVQVYDMRDVYVEKYTCMKENYYKETLLDDEQLKGISDKKVLMLIGRENFELERILAVWAANHDMGVAYSIANTGKYINAEMYTQGFGEAVVNGQIRPDVVYVTLDEEVMQSWRDALVGQEYVEYKRNYYYFVYTE